MEQIDMALVNWLLYLVVGGVLLYIAASVVCTVFPVVAFLFAACRTRKTNPDLATREQLHEERLEKIRQDINRGCGRTDGPLVMPDGK